VPASECYAGLLSVSSTHHTLNNCQGGNARPRTWSQTTLPRLCGGVEGGKFAVCPRRPPNKPAGSRPILARRSHHGYDLRLNIDSNEKQSHYTSFSKRQDVGGFFWAGRGRTSESLGEEGVETFLVRGQNNVNPGGKQSY